MGSSLPLPPTVVASEPFYELFKERLVRYGDPSALRYENEEAMAVGFAGGCSLGMRDCRDMSLELLV